MTVDDTKRVALLTRGAPRNMSGGSPTGKKTPGRWRVPDPVVLRRAQEPSHWTGHGAWRTSSEMRLGAGEAKRRPRRQTPLAVPRAPGVFLRSEPIEAAPVRRDLKSHIRSAWPARPSEATP